jgi:hypothetical protein
MASASATSERTIASPAIMFARLAALACLSAACVMRDASSFNRSSSARGSSLRAILVTNRRFL